ncbi:unnamed protein product, partial [Ascophyllum nodosum]
QESHKSFVPGKRDVYKCGYCQKQFRTQFYMDRHMENKHADRLDKAEGSWGCLADLCDALGCGRHAGDQCGDRRGGAAPERNSACGKCDASEMDHRRYKCKALFHRCAIAIWTMGVSNAGGQVLQPLQRRLLRGARRRRCRRSARPLRATVLPQPRLRHSAPVPDDGLFRHRSSGLRRESGFCESSGRSPAHPRGCGRVRRYGVGAVGPIHGQRSTTRGEARRSRSRPRRGSLEKQRLRWLCDPSETTQGFGLTTSRKWTQG